MNHEWRMIVAGGAGRRAGRRWTPELRAGGIDVDGADDLVEIIRHPGDHARSDAVAEVLAAVQLRIMRTRLDERDHLLVAYLQLTVRRQLGRAGSRRILRATPETPLEVLDGFPGGDGDGVRFAETVLHSSDRRCAAEHVAVIVTSGVRAGVLTLDDAELLLIGGAGRPISICPSAAARRRPPECRTICCRDVHQREKPRFDDGQDEPRRRSSGRANRTSCRKPPGCQRRRLQDGVTAVGASGIGRGSPSVMVSVPELSARGLRSGSCARR
jgi:hypothetical protein